MLLFIELPTLFLQDKWTYYRSEECACTELNFKLLPFSNFTLLDTENDSLFFYEG